MVTMFDLYQKPILLVSGIILISLWSILWKGMALWFSAKHKQKGWFIVLLVFNTMGILPLIYLIWNRPKSEKIKVEKKDTKKSVPETNITKKEQITKVTTKKEALIGTKTPIETTEPKKEPETKPPKEKYTKTQKKKTEKKVETKKSSNNEDDEMSMQL